MAELTPLGIQTAANAASFQVTPGTVSNVQDRVQNNTADRDEATPPVSARVNISADGQARLLAEQAQVQATPGIVASNAPSAPQNVPVAATGNAPTLQNETATTAFAPNAQNFTTGVNAAGPGLGPNPNPAPNADLAGAAPAVPLAAATPATPATPAAPAAPVTPAGAPQEAAERQVEAQAGQTQVRQDAAEVARQDTSPVLAQSGISTYRGIFSS
ncbi:MAG: hypothetical protein LBB51_00760 [Zoogloeaceae bacterium]|nr:hypothetical protein [Zoogloeaceae bacterium]